MSLTGLKNLCLMFITEFLLDFCISTTLALIGLHCNNYFHYKATWCFWKLSAKDLMLLNCAVGEDSWESLDCKEIKPVHPKGDQSWVFIGRTDAKAKTPILWPLDVKSWLIGKDPDAGKDWRQEEKGTIENEIVGWHHWLNGREFEQASGVGDGQGSLVCYSPWSHKDLEPTEWLNWTDRATQAALCMWNALAIFPSNLIPSISSTDVSSGKLSLASLL